MKTIATLIAVTLLCSIMAVPALAQTTDPKVTIDLEDLTPAQVAQLMALKESAENGPPSGQSAAEVAEEWATFGEKFGQVIASICKELGIAVNDFIETPVGKLAAIMIVWKVIGSDLWGIIGGTSVWFVVTGILMWSFRYFHMKVKIKDKDGGISFVKRHEFNSGDARVGSVAIHVVLFAAITGTCLPIVF